MSQLQWRWIGLGLFFWQAMAWPASDIPVRLEHFVAPAPVKQATLIQGGRFFAKRCMSCHGLKFFTHDAIGVASGVVPSKMPTANPSAWNGHPPPDLSLVTRYRGTDWLYTYLLSFYEDKQRPTGSNNLLLLNSSMPNPYPDLQGIKQLVINQKHLLVLAKTSPRRRPPWYRVLKLVHAGEVSHEAFVGDVRALVMFLDYVAEPQRAHRRALGPWVLGFLAVLFAMAWCLKKEYWRDVSRSD